MSRIAEVLRSLPYFTDLPEALIVDVCRASEELEVPAGTRIIEEGSRSEEMYVLVEGELQVTKRTGSDKEVVLATHSPIEVVGEIALLEGAPRTASVATTRDSRLIKIPEAAFEQLLRDPRVIRRMFRTVTSRLRGIENTLRHEERMAALGRMAAQLMHELNNPAAAIGRSSATLQEVYAQLGEAARDLVGSEALAGRQLPDPEPAGGVSALARAEKEDQVATWLEARGLTDAWDLAPALVAAGWGTELLDAAADGLDGEESGRLARWLGLRALTSQVIDEIRIGAGRISELVRIVKDYSFLDRAPIQEIDPTAGIADTLVLLKHKLGGIDTVLDFAPDLPKIEAPGRDLNQVWTNLIDNAADAMGGNGTLTITAAEEDGHVVIRVSDTGGGIPPDVVDRIFDPFFTTKEPGKGTGLGLHTVHTIVNRTGGEISVESDSTGTTFTLRFPAVGGAPEGSP